MSCIDLSEQSDLDAKKVNWLLTDAFAEKEDNKDVEELNLSNTQMFKGSTEECKDVATTILTITHPDTTWNLLRLNLSNNIGIEQTDGDSWVLLAQCLKKNKTITDLDISFNNFGIWLMESHWSNSQEPLEDYYTAAQFEGALPFLHVLHTMFALKKLNMSNNRIGCNECKLLAISLETNPIATLQTLDLSSNDLHHEYNFEGAETHTGHHSNGIDALKGVMPKTNISNLIADSCYYVKSVKKEAQPSEESSSWFWFGGGTRKTKRNTGVHRSLTRRTHRRTARNMRRHRKHTNRSIRRKRQQVKRKSFLRRRR